MPLTRKQIVEINKTVEESIKNVLTVNSTLMKEIVNEVAKEISRHVDQRLKKLEKENTELRAENAKLNDDDAVEQNSRQNSIRIFRLEEREAKNTEEKVIN